MIYRIFIVAVCIASTNAFAADKQRIVRPPIAAPFGVVIDKTSCAEAARLLKGSLQKLPNSQVRVAAQDATDYFSGATRLEVTCNSADAPVNSLILVLQKGPGQDATVDMVMAGLKAKYDKPTGRVSATDVEVAFSAANAQISIFALNEARTFMVRYYNKALAEELRQHEARFLEKLNKMRSEQVDRL